jgi:RimJ/RimL family protein N-acetyltransferase
LRCRAGGADQPERWTIVALSVSRRPAALGYHRPMRDAFLVGTAVYLRPLDESDAATCWAWLNDPDIRRTLAHRAGPNTESMTRAWIRGLDQRHEQVFAIVARDGDVHVGNGGLHAIDFIDRHATLGIVIGRKERWGEGLGTDAVRLLCRYAFDGLDLHKVSLSCYANNERGLRLYARVGFVAEGRRREQIWTEGRRVDELVLGMLRGELRA